jgi:hypothetical protein
MFFAFVHVTLEPEEKSVVGPEFSIVLNSIREHKVTGTF